jgi:hypothetical protein
MAHFNFLHDLNYSNIYLINSPLEIKKNAEIVWREDFNKLGKSGWELILMNKSNYIFKREILNK